MLAKDTLAVDIKNTSAPKRLLRPLDTSEFETAVDSVILQNIRMGKTTDLRLLVKLREEVPFSATQEGNTLFIDLDRPKKPEVKAEAGPPKTEGAPAEAQKEEAARAVSAEEKGPAAKGPEITEEGRQEKAYTGRKISLDFKDADVKNVLRLIAEVSNLNIIAGDDVGGKVTMRLVDVPWDQALDVILQSRSLGMSRVGNVVRVAPQDVLKKEVQGELEAKRAKERLEDLVTELLPVNYATAKEVIPQVKSILGDRGDVRVDERTNMLIVKDVPRNMLAVRNLVKALDTKTPQVLIEARIIEASLQFQQELGVSWGILLSTGEGQNKTFKFGGGIPGRTLGETTNNVVTLPAIPASGAAVPGLIEFLFTSVYGLKELDIAISAHENKGDVKIISSPKIATLDNKQASIEQGLRIPYLKLTTEGTVTTDFIEANLKLTVTPHVTNDGNIKMLIDVRKDAPDYTVTVQGVPRIDKKEAISEVLVRDNGVVVIAGVYSIEKDDTNEGIPLFNKLPLLGWLFKRQTKNDQRKDLLIFISPKILRDQA
jgi:type IV pilus assembly protein PilQ